MIDNFLGIDTEVGVGGHWTLRFLPYNAACSDDSFFFIKDRSSLQYFITQGMGQSSTTFRTICNFRGRTSALGRVGGGEGGIPGRLHTCLL